MPEPAIKTKPYPTCGEREDKYLGFALSIAQAESSSAQLPHNERLAASHR